MDKAPDFGPGDCRFESCHGRNYKFLSGLIWNSGSITTKEKCLTAVGFEPTPFRTGA